MTLSEKIVVFLSVFGLNLLVVYVFYKSALIIKVKAYRQLQKPRILAYFTLIMSWLLIIYGYIMAIATVIDSVQIFSTKFEPNLLSDLISSNLYMVLPSLVFLNRPDWIRNSIYKFEHNTETKMVSNIFKNGTELAKNNFVMSLPSSNEGSVENDYMKGYIISLIKYNHIYTIIVVNNLDQYGHYFEKALYCKEGSFSFGVGDISSTEKWEQINVNTMELFVKSRGGDVTWIGE